MSRRWTSKASALSVAVLSVYITLPLQCLGAVQYEQTCYFPDQSVAAGYTACNITASGTQASASSCCLNSPFSYCTSTGLCYTNGLLSRGGCTDRTWNNAACPRPCNNVLKQGFVNLFQCHGEGANAFQCGIGNGPGDCSTHLLLPNQTIYLRADQEPGAPNALEYWDPSATFVNKAAASSVPTASNSNASNSTAAASTGDDDYGPSVTAVGLGVGLPLGFLLLVSLGIIIWQERRIQNSKKYPAKVDHADLLRATTTQAHQASGTPEQVGRPAPYAWRGGEMPTAWYHQAGAAAANEPPRSGSSPAVSSASRGGAGTQRSGSLRVPATRTTPRRSESLHHRVSDDAHELESPGGMKPRNGF